MEKITNYLQNNGTLNITHQVLITKSNEQIERTIPTIKKTLKKNDLNLMATHNYFIVLRTSHGHENTTSPAMLLFSRPIKIILPSMNTNIALTDKKIYRKSNNYEYN